jgi:2-(1,2-epoxy-1,2-dihydrophenyl)acetyl-CoA isomerase
VSREQASDEVSIERVADGLAIVEFDRPPHNFFDAKLISGVADAYERLETEGCGAIVLASAGRHFCAGANFADENPASSGALYEQAVRLFSYSVPVVAAVQGAAIGGGLGVALSADLRVATPQSRFSANFARLGIHHGFGLTVTLPLVVGHQKSLELLYTGVRLRGKDAFGIGLCDQLVSTEDLRAAAIALATEIATSAPLAVKAIRRTMRGDLPARVLEATAHEGAEQAKLFGTEDFAEGIAASSERRAPRFIGR